MSSLVVIRIVMGRRLLQEGDGQRASTIAVLEIGLAIRASRPWLDWLH